MNMSNPLKIINWIRFENCTSTISTILERVLIFNVKINIILCTGYKKKTIIYFRLTNIVKVKVLFISTLIETKQKCIRLHNKTTMKESLIIQFTLFFSNKILFYELYSWYSIFVCMVNITYVPLKLQILIFSKSIG